MMKILFRSIREYKKQSLQAPILVALEVVMEVVIPLLMANLIDFGIEKGDMGYIWTVSYTHLQGLKKAKSILLEP